MKYPCLLIILCTYSPIKAQDTIHRKSPDTIQARLDIVMNAFDSNHFTDDQIDSMAIQDAKLYYKGSGTGTGVFFATFLGTPVTGIITTFIVTAIPPKPRNLNIPDKPIAEKPKYIDTYKNQAFNIKREKALANFAGGFVSALIVFLYISSVANR